MFGLFRRKTANKHKSSDAPARPAPRVNKVKSRLLPLSPIVLSGQERECTTDDFESLSRSVIGRGAFASVWPVRHKASREKYAVKLIKKVTISQNGLLESIRREVQIMYQVRDNHIIRLHDHFEDDHKVYLLLEYAPAGTLFDLVDREGPLSPMTAAKFLREVVQAVRCLHS